MHESETPQPASDDWFVVALIPLQTRLYRYIASLVPERADAEDLFQKSLLTGWQQRQRFDPALDLYAWLCGIARNHVRHHYRAAGRNRVTVNQDVINQLAERLEAEDRHFQQQQAALTECLGKLPVAQRELVEGYYHSGHTIRDFATGRGLGVEAVYKSLQRIRAALAHCIAQTLAREAHS